MGKSALMSLNISLEQTTVSRNTMKTIIIKIDFSSPVTGFVLHEIGTIKMELSSRLTTNQKN